MPKITSSLAKSDDGTVQITFSIPAGIVEKNKEIVLSQLAKDIEIPGFRKGKAPLTKVKEKVTEKVLLERILNRILPHELSHAFEIYKIKPVMYPKLELLSAKVGEDWQVRITTCEMPEVALGDYQTVFTNSVKTQAIWTPEKEKPQSGESKQNEPQKLDTAQKEQLVIKAILETTKVKIPKPLIDEEVNSRLSKLLEQIEKLDLTLESYLSSIGKNVETLRKEYEKQAGDSITLELALNKIAESEKVEIKDGDIDSAIQASTTADPKLSEKLNTPEQRRVVAGILQRRETLNKLVNLIP